MATNFTQLKRNETDQKQQNYFEARFKTERQLPRPSIHPAGEQLLFFFFLISKNNCKAFPKVTVHSLSTKPTRAHQENTAHLQAREHQVSTFVPANRGSTASACNTSFRAAKFGLHRAASAGPPLPPSRRQAWKIIPLLLNQTSQSGVEPANVSVSVPRKAQNWLWGLHLPLCTSLRRRHCSECPR